MIPNIRPQLYMLVGLPATGKSSWSASWPAMMHLPFSVISSDKVVEYLAKSYNLTYNQVFNAIDYNQIENIIFALAQECIKRGDNIIWDQTNLTPRSRIGKLSLFSEVDYFKTAVIFHTPEHHDKWLNRPGKIIPEDVIENMKKTYLPPSLSEGFDNILEWNQ